MTELLAGLDMVKKSVKLFSLLTCEVLKLPVRYGHGGGGSRKINAWHIYTLMVYL